MANHIQRAALSIALNIAEGSSRTTKDFAHLLSVARGSCYECIPLLAIAQDQKLVNHEEYELLYDRVNYLARMLTSLKERISLTSK